MAKKAKAVAALPAYEDTLPADESLPAYEETTSAEGPGRLAALGLGGAQGLTFDFADEIAAAAKTPFSEKPYKENVREMRDVFKSAQEAHPGYYVGGAIGGAALPVAASEIFSGGGATPIAGARVAALAKMAKPLISPTTLKGLAASGALFGLGGSEADVTEGEAGQLAKDVGKGALTSVALGKGIPAVAETAGRGLSKLGGALGEGGEFLASKAVGLSKALRKKFGLSPTETRAIGREALESGTIAPFSDAEEMARRNLALNKGTGKQIGGIIKEASETGMTPDIDAMIADLTQSQAKYADSKVGRPTFRQIQNVIDDLKAMKLKGEPQVVPGKPTGLLNAEGKPVSTPTTQIPGEPATIGELQKYKEVLGEAAYPKGVASESKAGLQRGYTPVKEELERSVGEALSPEQKEVYKSLKVKYGKQDIIEEGLKERVAAEEGNRFIRPTDFLVGGAFGLGGGVVPGIAAVVAKRGIEKYGHQVGAITMDRVGKLLQATPEVFGPYAPLLQKAVARGGMGFATTTFLLQQKDPNFRKVMDDLDGGQ